MKEVKDYSIVYDVQALKDDIKDKHILTFSKIINVYNVKTHLGIPTYTVVVVSYLNIKSSKLVSKKLIFEIIRSKYDSMIDNENIRIAYLSELLNCLLNDIKKEKDDCKSTGAYQI
jgi:hypothetical protein